MTQRWRVLLAVAAGLWLSSRAFAEPLTREEGEPPADVEEPNLDDASQMEPHEQDAGDSTTVPLEGARSDTLQGKDYEEAQFHESQGQYQEAIKAYRRASQRNRRQPDILSRIAFCYGMLQDYPNAISYYRDALRIQPDLVEERFRLGEAYFHSGQTELALTQYRMLMKTDQQKAAELKQLIEVQQGVSVDELEPPAPDESLQTPEGDIPGELEPTPQEPSEEAP